MFIFFLLILTSGCKDDSTGPEKPTLSSFFINEFDLEDRTYSLIDTQKVDSVFNVVIVARDQNNDTLKSYTGSVILTLNGTSSFLPETTDVFEDGWTSQLIVISDTGKFTFTARQTGGSHTGTSNEFYVVSATGLTQSIRISQSFKKQ